MNDSSTAPRRPYDNSARERKAARTREHIVSAAGDLVHEFDIWDWQELTFRAVAKRAGVSERTVYRHFPTERHLHDAIMRRLEEDAGVSYDDVDLTDLEALTGRVFAALQRFSVQQSVQTTRDPTFATVDERRRDALHRAVSASTPQWADADRRAVAGLLDVLWNVPTYERLVGAWGINGPDATRAVGWLMAQVVQAIERGESPLA